MTTILAWGTETPSICLIFATTSVFSPAYALLSIDFEIYIPQRLQNQLTELHEDVPVETETFSVLINYDYEMPFTIVSYDTTEEMPDSSRAVVVIRRYLERQFKDDFVTFCSLGPSPFHADLLLKQSTSAADPTFSVHDLSEPGGGYKRFEIRYSNKIRTELAHHCGICKLYWSFFVIVLCVRARPGQSDVFVGKCS